MPITDVQLGLITQQEFAKLLMMGSGGDIEVAAPLTDDERRDYEIHVRGDYGFGLAVQVKGVREAKRGNANQARYMNVSFRVRAERVVSHPFFWYFFGCFDGGLMRFIDPVFLVPSEFFHAQASPIRQGAFWHFTIDGNLEANSHDKWRPFRVSPLLLGERVLEIMRDLKKQQGQLLTFAAVPTDSEILWLRRAA